MIQKLFLVLFSWKLTLLVSQNQAHNEHTGWVASLNGDLRLIIKRGIPHLRPEQTVFHANIFTVTNNFSKMMPNINNPMSNQMNQPGMNQMMGNQGMPISMPNQPPMMNPNMMPQQPNPHQNPMMTQQQVFRFTIFWNFQRNCYKTYSL